MGCSCDKVETDDNNNRKIKKNNSKEKEKIQKHKY